MDKKEKELQEPEVMTEGAGAELSDEELSRVAGGTVVQVQPANGLPSAEDAAGQTVYEKMKMNLRALTQGSESSEN